MDASKIQELLKEKQDEIVEAVKRDLIANVTRNNETQIMQLVAKEVEKFFSEDVAPALRQALADDKGAIVEATKVAASHIAIALSEKMVAEATKHLNDGFNFGEIMKRLFKGY